MFENALDSKLARLGVEGMKMFENRPVGTPGHSVDKQANACDLLLSLVQLTRLPKVS